MKTKSILLLVIIASAMIKVFLYLCILSVLILEMIQDHALVASKQYLVETKDKNLADNGRDAKIWNRNLRGADFNSHICIDDISKIPQLVLSLTLTTHSRVS